MTCVKVWLRVPAVEDEDAAASVVGEVVHAGGEDAAVRRLARKRTRRRPLAATLMSSFAGSESVMVRP